MTLRFGTRSLVSLRLFLVPVSCLFSPLISELEGSRAAPPSSSSSTITAEQRRCPLQAPPPPPRRRGLVVWGRARGQQWSRCRGTTSGGWGVTLRASSQEQWWCWTEAVAHAEWSRENGVAIGDLGEWSRENGVGTTLFRGMGKK
jgi:hypothetical protein